MSSTICVTDTSVIPFPTLDSAYTQTSNTAAGPLPHIPCRNARLSPLPSFSDVSILDSNPVSPSDGADYGTRSTAYMRYDSGSSSSSSSDEPRPTIIPRSKRVASPHSIITNPRDMFSPIAPASTPIKANADGRLFASLESRRQTPLRDPSDEEDTVRPFPGPRPAPFSKVGKLRLEGSTGKLARHASDSDVTITRAPAATAPNVNPPSQTIRKKSGQPVKSSLKSARRPELHVVTNGSFAKSEPVTPTHAKAVHFDSKLEHVKLFLAAQKPLAVSRDGSPTSDTDGEDFPSFIYGNGRPESQQQVKMLVPNMPSSPRKDDNVALQDLVLCQDQRTITGNVRVRNIAYEKWVAIRFTMDWWQTTSEVTARYDKSIEDGAFDVFSFIIRLHDFWSRINEKTILIALRYVVAGQEYWDNNAGKNYQIKFVLVPPPEPSSAVDSETSLRHLDLKLEGVAKARSVPTPTSSYRLGRSFSADHQFSSFTKSLSGRYDFASAYKTQRTRDTSSPPQRHVRTHTHPSGAPVSASSAVAPWFDKAKVRETEQITSPPRTPPLSLGPLPEEELVGTPTPPAQAEAKPALPASPNLCRSPDGRERNHRRGYVDRVVEGSPNLRRTPTGSPLMFDFTSKDGAAPLPRTKSYPFARDKPGFMAGSSQQWAPKLPLSIQTISASDGASGESTPDGSTSSSGTSSTSSCTSLLSPPPDCSRSDASYKQFIDQFCFYTGSDSLFQESSEALPRSHSASSIQRYLLSHSPPESFVSHARPVFL